MSAAEEVVAYRDVLAGLARGAHFTDVASMVARHARALLDAEGASVSQLIGDHFCYIAMAGSTEPMLGRTQAADSGFTADVIRSRRATLFDREVVGTESRRRAMEDSIASGVVAPILVADRVVGTLGVASSRPNAFDQEDVAILRAFADHLALGLMLLDRQEALERTAAELRETNEKLAVARDKADEANRAKSNFLARMSHELRTPMNAVIGMTDLLIHCDPNESQREPLEVVMLAAKAMVALTTDLLDLSRVEAGRLRLANTRFELRRCLESTVALFEPQAAGKSVTLDLRIAGDVPDRLRGDPGRLRQVVTNLVGNAIKFTDAGSVDVRVERVGGGDDGVELSFTVRDTGVGVAPELHEQIFDAFTLADESSTRSRGGAGLGLSICRSLVEMMDGRIGVDSELGAGSTFRFTARFGQ